MWSWCLRSAAVAAALVLPGACAVDDDGWYAGLRDHVHATWVPPRPPPDRVVEPVMALTPMRRSEMPQRPYLAPFAAQDIPYHHRPLPVLMRSEIERGFERPAPLPPGFGLDAGARRGAP